MLTYVAYGLPILALLAGFIMRWLAWRLKWEQSTRTTESKKDKPKDQRTSKTTAPRAWWEKIGSYIQANRWAFALAAVVTLIILFVLLNAPPRLTGKIPILPNQSGRPFYGLRWLRNSLNVEYDLYWHWSTILCSLVSLALLVWAAIRRSRLAVEVSILSAALTLAGLGQWMLGSEQEILGWGFYALAVLGFGMWGWLARKRLGTDLEMHQAIPRWAEIVIVLALLALNAYTRLYAFPTVPYGIEGDETKWTSEAVNLMLDAKPDLSGEYHRDALPVSFYMQAPFHHLLGASIFSARLEVIFFSILASLFFYWLLRQIAPLPLAALGAYLLSASAFDISASRLANVESHVKIWPILTLGLLALAIRKRRWEIYTLSGIAMALGLLTYDTVWPLLTVVLILAAIDLFKQPDSLKHKALCIAMLILPTLLSMPLLVPYTISRLSYYNVAEKGWSTGIFHTLALNLSGVIRSWFVATRSDFLYNRPGPLLNAFLLPWLVLGATAAWSGLRKPFPRLILTWALMFILPVPILANSPLGRVYYPALPAVYGLIALGMFLFWREITRLLGNLISIAAVIAISVLLWLPILNMYIYFNEVTDAQDRLIRREIGEMAGQAIGEDTLLVLPVIPGANEPLNNEYQIIELYLHKDITAEEIAQTYRYVSYDQFLPGILGELSSWQNLEILLDKVSPGQRARRDQVSETLTRCFPEVKLHIGTYFDRYSLDTAARKRPECIPVQLNLTPDYNASSSTLVWSLSRGSATSIRLFCQRFTKDLVWLEAENVTQSAGWVPESTYASGWSGEGFLMDSYYSHSSQYEIVLPREGEIYVWVRYYKRAIDNSPAYIMLNSQSILSFANATPEQLNQWVWERVGPFETSNRYTSWILTRPYIDNPRQFMALFVDAFIFTSSTTFTPEDKPLYYDMLPESVYPVSGQSYGTIPLTLDQGRYQCQAQVESRQPLVDAYGNTPVLSNPLEFEVIE